MDDVLAAGYGARVKTHLGRAYAILKPSLYDLVKGVKRQTQIIYPKEIGYIVMKLGIGPGVTVVEAGGGSGSLTVALAYWVGDRGKVYTYDRREEFSKLNQKNLAWAGLDDGRVEHRLADVGEEGFGLDHEADALFLDMRTPWDAVPHIAAAVKPGAPVGFLLPTVGQVSDLLVALEQGPFQDIEVLEILLRRWKTVPDRMRPEDRMVAHTGFLIFARCQGEVAVEPEAPAEEAQTPPDPEEGSEE